jgi:prepilin-type N-terminal cleavage/methylation domain-containing protein
MRPLRSERNRTAFTLIELLVSASVIAILLALLLPAVQQAREAARKTSCRNNLHQIGLALHNYHDACNAFPPLNVNDGIPSPTQFPSGWWSWLTRTLPYIDQKPLYDELKPDDDAVLPFLDCVNVTQVSQKIDLYLCPSDPYSERLWSADWGGPGPVSAAHTNYFGCRGSTRTVPGDGVFPAANVCKRIKDITDGFSNTILVGERPEDEVGEWGWWAFGTGFDGDGLADHVIDCSEGLHRGTPGSSNDLTHFWSMHHGGAHFLMTDGSVHFLSYSINHDTFIAMGSRNGGEVNREP